MSYRKNVIHSYRKNDSPHSVECDIVMTDTSSSQQGGMRGIASPCQNDGDASPSRTVDAPGFGIERSKVKVRAMVKVGV